MDSTKKPGTKCLYIQIQYEGENRLLFSGSKYLLEMILAVKEEDFLFKATIKKEYKSLHFT
jgi:DNA-dependent RNA polymerase auxiliary subunit epsilon